MSDVVVTLKKIKKKKYYTKSALAAMQEVTDCICCAGPALRGCGRCDRTGPPKIGGLQKFLCYEACQVISNIFAYKPAHLDVERDSDHLSIWHGLWNISPGLILRANV